MLFIFETSRNLESRSLHAMTGVRSRKGAQSSVQIRLVVSDVTSSADEHYAAGVRDAGAD